MRRRLLLILLLLVGGAVLNIAVAWGLGWRVQYQMTDASYQAMIDGTITVDPATGDNRGPAGLAILQYRGTGAEHVIIQTIDWTRVDDPVARRPLQELWPRWGSMAHRTPREVFREGLEHPIGQAARGWPMLSMWCEFEQGHGILRGGWIVKRTHTPGTFIVTDHVLPRRPAWPGFAINTVFYAAVLWLLFAAPFALRRRWRIRRGLCPKCAYPVGDSAVCTECGAAVRLGRRAYLNPLSTDATMTHAVRASG